MSDSAEISAYGTLAARSHLFVADISGLVEETDLSIEQPAAKATKAGLNGYFSDTGKAVSALLPIPITMPVLQQTQQRILLHSFFWLVYILIWFMGLIPLLSPLKAMGWSVIASLGMVPFVYFNLLYGIPELLWKGTYFRYVLFFLLLSAGGVYLNNELYRITAAFGTELFNSDSPSILYSVVLVPLTMFITTSMKMLKNSVDQQELNRNLETQQLQSELNFLKTQVNPHFLFNTLNNLYALTLAKSERAPEVVLKLSAILRYMLYECNEKLVYLTAEIQYLQNYIELEELRQGGSNYIRLQVEGNTDGHKVAPLLFTPLLENAIKHGLNKTVGHAWVHIDMYFQDDQLRFEIENNKTAKHKNSTSDVSGGIGLINVKRRLELLYPQKHSFGIIETPETYKVVLNLILEE